MHAAFAVRKHNICISLDGARRERGDYIRTRASSVGAHKVARMRSSLCTPVRISANSSRSTGRPDSGDSGAGSVRPELIEWSARNGCESTNGSGICTKCDQMHVGVGAVCTAVDCNVRDHKCACRVCVPCVYAAPRRTRPKCINCASAFCCLRRICYTPTYTSCNNHILIACVCAHYTHSTIVVDHSTQI